MNVIRPIGTVVLLWTVAVVCGGCASHRVKPLQYTDDNPYAPGGVLHESWEEKRQIDGILHDSRVTHTAVGAGGGAIAGQAIGRDTEGTLWGVGIGAATGLTSGSVNDHNRKVEHEDRMTRMANNWQIERNQEMQNQRDVAMGAMITDEEIQARLRRLEAARAALAERNRNVDRARQIRELDAEIERLNNTTTTRGPR